MKPRSKIMILGLSIVGLGMLGRGAVSRAREEVATILPGSITRVIVARASVVPVDGVSKIRTRLDGTVIRVHVREGQAVKAGTLLAEIEAHQVTQRVARAHAEVAVLEAELKGVLHGGRPEAQQELASLRVAAEHELTLARQDAERATTLHANGSLSEVATSEAKAVAEIAQARLTATEARLAQSTHGGPFEVSAARHRLEAAQAGLAAVEAELSHRYLLAPVAGVVLSRRVDAGDVVRVLDGSVLFEVADPTHVELRGEVEELQAPWVRTGARAQITAPGGQVALGQGHVTRIAPGVGNRMIAGDPSELRADSLVRAVYIEPDAGTLQGLPLGQRLEVRIALEEERVAARVPREAVKLENGRASVLVQTGLLREQHTVRLGIADDRHVQVHGLPLGTHVVVAPHE